jgi:uncharacterized protein YgbK (DUF1537 family)
VNERVLPAGAAEFFAALLEERGFVRIESDQDIPRAGATTLIVCGSATDRNVNVIDEVRKRTDQVRDMPRELLSGETPKDDALHQWADGIENAFRTHLCVILTTDYPVIREPSFARALREAMAKVVARLLRRQIVHELYVEGGATASAIVKLLDWVRFVPLGELAPGVVRMRVHREPGIHLTIKPGSYLWPKSVMQLFDHVE